MTSKIIAEEDGAIGWITINNPERRNAVSLEMWRGLSTAIKNFDADDAIRVVVMRGAGDQAFMSGADISEFDSNRSSAAAGEAYYRVSKEAGAALRAFRKPLIAMIRGFCIGGGLATALKADIRIATKGSQFGIPAARLGLSYSFEAMQTLSRVVGRATASEIMFTGRRFSAEEALQMKLINQLTEDEALEPNVRRLAETIVANAPLTIQAVKRSLVEAEKEPDKRDMAAIEELNRRCMDSQDYAEGRRAFAEKRLPVFRGF